MEWTKEKPTKPGRYAFRRNCFVHRDGSPYAGKTSCAIRGVINMPTFEARFMANWSDDYEWSELGPYGIDTTDYL